MAKFFTLYLSKETPKSKPKVRICSEDCIPNKGEKSQTIGMFETQEEATMAREIMGEQTLIGYWGRKVYLECRNGRIGFSTIARRREFFAKFVR